MRSWWTRIQNTSWCIQCIGYGIRELYALGFSRFQPRPQGLLAFQYGGGRREDPGTQRTKTISDWCIPWCVHTCALIGLLLSKTKILALWRLRGDWEALSSEFRTKKVDGIQVWLFGKLWLYRLKANSKKVHRFNSYFHRCSACVLRYPRSSFSHP